MPKGAIQFVGDSSQLTAESEKARKSVSAVAASAEDARKRIVDSYKMQMQAAQEAGASQRELASITSRATSMLAQATEDNAQRYINSINKMEDRTRRFNAARGSLASAIAPIPIASFDLSGYGAQAKGAEELSRAIEGVGRSASYAVAPSVRFGAVIRGMEGGFSRNVRAAEYFGASLKFLQPIMETAFPIVGAVTLGYALVEMGEHAYDAFQNIVLLRDAINGLNKLQINVAQTVNRDNDAAEGSVESILESTQGKAASLRQRYQYQQQKPVDLSSYFYSKEFSGLTTSEKANYENLYKSVAPADVPNRLQSIREEITKLQDALATSKTSGAFVPKVDGYGPSLSKSPDEYYNLRLIAARQIQAQLQAGSTAKSANLQELQVQIPQAQKEDQKKKQEEANSARQKALEFQRSMDAAAISQQNANFLQWQSIQDRSKLDVELYWSSIVALTSDGSKRALDAKKKYLDAVVALNREDSESQKRTIDQFKSGYMGNFYETAGLSKRDRSDVDQGGHDALAYVTSLRDSINLTKQSTISLSENALQMAVATGQMTRLDAARALASLHQQDYIKGLKELSEEADAIKNDPLLSDLGRQASLQENANRTKQFQMQYTIQAAQDRLAANPGSSSALVGATDALNEFVEASRNAAGMMREIVTNVLGGFNQAVVGSITGQRGGFRQFGLGVTRTVASKGLETAEGSIFGAFGFGGGKLGTKGNPIYTISAGSTGASAASSLSSLIPSSKGTGVAGFFGGLMKTVLPFLATGGDFSDGAIVGEAGPELVMGSGHVTSNRNLRTMLGSGGGTSISYSIDARGTDPVQTDMRVRTAIVAAHQSSVKQSVKQVHQDAARRPSRSR